MGESLDGTRRDGGFRDRGRDGQSVETGVERRLTCACLGNSMVHTLMVPTHTEAVENAECPDRRLAALTFCPGERRDAGAQGQMEGGYRLPSARRPTALRRHSSSSAWRVAPDAEFQSRLPLAPFLPIRPSVVRLALHSRASAFQRTALADCDCRTAQRVPHASSARTTSRRSSPRLVRL